MKSEILVRIEQIKNGDIPEGYKRTKVGIVPKEWEVQSINDILNKVGEKVDVKQDVLYKQIGIRSHGKGIFYKEPSSGESLGNKSVFWIKPNCLIVNIVFAWEQAVARTTNIEKGMIGSHRFPMYFPRDNKSNVDYLLYFFLTKRGKLLLEDASPGGAGRNKTLGQKEFAQSKLVVPSIEEQQKIVKILITQDRIIELKEKLIIEKKQQKKYLMQNLLTGKKRLKGFSGEWKNIEFGQIFDYIQPTPYLVKSTNYDDKYQTPVLTAGKTFVLGYTDETIGIYTEVPVVIFDDFTTSSKYVSFPFKVKSSAIKILRCKCNYNIIFAFAQLYKLDYSVGGHERHWISKISCIPVKVPSLTEQTAIAEILSTADQEIELLEQQLEKEKQKKKSLMQLLLTGIVRV